MKQEIKDRIEKIRKGEVPKGYRDSEIGIVPTDWRVVSFGSLGTWKKGKGIPNYDIKANGLPAIRYGDIYMKYNTFFKQSDFMIDEETAKSSTAIKKGDLIFTGSGESAEEIGKCVVYLGDETAYIGGDIIALTPSNGDSLFLSYQQNAYIQIKKKAKLGQGYSVVHIYSNFLKSIAIPFPEKIEQKKIAEILFAWDDGIAIREKLIYSMRMSKKGYVQRLVNPIPGKKSKYLELSKCLIPTSYPVDKPTKPYDALGIRSHCKGTMVKPVSDPSKVDMDTLYEVKENELIVNITFAWEGAIALLSKKDEGKLVSHRFPTFRFNEASAIPDYFKHLIKTKWFVFQLGLVSPGGAGRNRVLSKKDFLKIKLMLPPVEKQRKIANFLNSLDQEIDMLERELKELKQQKKGLMQLLLTGIGRVKA